MLITRPPDIPASELTEEGAYATRREFLRAAGFGLAALAGGAPLPRRGLERAFGADDDKLTPWDDITGYNNYYEFGTDKEDPSRNATRFRSRPWKVEIEGEVNRPAAYDLDDLLKGLTPAQRV